MADLSGELGVEFEFDLYARSVRELLDVLHELQITDRTAFRIDGEGRGISRSVVIHPPTQVGLVLNRLTGDDHTSTDLRDHDARDVADGIDGAVRLSYQDLSCVRVWAERLVRNIAWAYGLGSEQPPIEAGVSGRPPGGIDFL